MTLPDNAIRKGIRNPKTATRWIWNRRPNTSEYIERGVTHIRGRRLYDYDWDCAVILDACRYDLGRDNQTATQTFGEPERVYSLGANSKRWIRRTFESATRSQRSNTHYVTANIFSTDCVPDDVSMTEVWRTHFDESLSTVPPESVTDDAIRIGREQSPQRMVVHYMQPHLPPIEEALEVDLDLDIRGGWGNDNPWRRVEAGDINAEIVEQAYRKNLTPVVESVAVLLNNLDAETVVVTADHGNLLGEGGRWGHFRSDVIHPGVRHVPWWETSATDYNSYYPTKEERETDELSRKEKLEALGYL